MCLRLNSLNDTTLVHCPRWSRLIVCVPIFLVALIVTAVCAASALAWPKPEVAQIEFASSLPILIDHEHDVLGEEPQEIKSFANEELQCNGEAVEWRAVAGHVFKNWPVAYVQNTTMTLNVGFYAGAARDTLKNRVEGNPTITGETTVAGKPLVFTTELNLQKVKSELKEGEYFCVQGISADQPLPAGVRHQQMEITWRWRAREKRNKGSVTLVQKLGSSRHHLYVTFQKPLSWATTYFTLLSLDSVTQEAPTEDSVVKNVWKDFTSMGPQGAPTTHLRTYNPASGTIGLGPTLKYYREEPPGRTLQAFGKTVGEIASVPGVCIEYTTKGLLESGEGRCGAWARAFKDALGVEGIESTVVGLKPTCEPCLMLVKNWKFGKPESGLTFPYSASAVTDQLGVPAQGVRNPPSAFTDHAVVRFDSSIYDPSYGAGPFTGGLLEYQKASIDGFCDELATETIRCEKAPPLLQLVEFAAEQQ
jgi:hypothetical protein